MGSTRGLIDLTRRHWEPPSCVAFHPMHSLSSYATMQAHIQHSFGIARWGEMHMQQHDPLKFTPSSAPSLTSLAALPPGLARPVHAMGRVDAHVRKCGDCRARRLSSLLRVRSEQPSQRNICTCIPPLCEHVVPWVHGPLIHTHTHTPTHTHTHTSLEHERNACNRHIQNVWLREDRVLMFPFRVVVPSSLCSLCSRLLLRPKVRAVNTRTLVPTNARHAPTSCRRTTGLPCAWPRAPTVPRGSSR
jgi:hypothetical protein